MKVEIWANKSEIKSAMLENSKNKNYKIKVEVKKCYMSYLKYKENLESQI